MEAPIGDRFSSSVSWGKCRTLVEDDDVAVEVVEMAFAMLPEATAAAAAATLPPGGLVGGRRAASSVALATQVRWAATSPLARAEISSSSIRYPWGMAASLLPSAPLLRILAMAAS